MKLLALHIWFQICKSTDYKADVINAELHYMGVNEVVERLLAGN
jgi:hypothetical protein